MTHDATASEEKSSRSYWGFVLWPVAVIVLYVLSVGPAGVAVEKGLLPRRVMIIYQPLLDVAFNTPLERPFGAYLRLWGWGSYNYHNPEPTYLQPSKVGH